MGRRRPNGYSLWRRYLERCGTYPARVDTMEQCGSVVGAVAYDATGKEIGRWPKPSPESKGPDDLVPDAYFARLLDCDPSRPDTWPKGFISELRGEWLARGEKAMLDKIVTKRLAYPKDRGLSPGHH